MVSGRKITNRIRDRAPPPRSGFQMLQTQNNPGGRWSGGGTGGGTENQVHVEVTRPGTEAKLAEQSTKAEQTRQEPTSAEQTGQESSTMEQEPTSAELTEQAASMAEDWGLGDTRVRESIYGLKDRGREFRRPW